MTTPPSSPLSDDRNNNAELVRLQNALSAYVDNALTDAERTQLDQRLASDPLLQAQLNQLQALKTVLRAVPVLRPPRDFTLDPALFGRVPWWARYRTMQRIGGLGVAAALILIALGSVLSPAQNTAVSRRSATSATAIAALSTDARTITLTAEADNLANQSAAASTIADTADKPIAQATLLATSAAFKSAEVSPMGTELTTQATGSGDVDAIGAVAASGTPPAANAAQQPLPRALPLTPTVTQMVMMAAPVGPPAAADSSAASESAADASVAGSSGSSTGSGSPPVSPLPEAGIAAPGIIAATIMIYPTQALTNTVLITATAVQINTQTSTQSDTLTLTPAPTPPVAPVNVSTPPNVPLLQIIGLTVLIFSVMLFSVGFMRSRILKNQN